MNKPQIETIIGQDIPLRGNKNELHCWCPFCSEKKDSRSDRFVVWKDKQRFWCRQCKKSGDVIEYVKIRDNCNFIEACRVLGITLDGNSSTRPRKITPEKAQSERKRLSQKSQIGFKDERWQYSAKEYVEKAQSRLWFLDSGKAGADYLRSRGLTDNTLWSALGIGYAPEYRGFFGDQEIWLPQGIVMPYESGGKVIGINVRNMSHGRKYIKASGSANTLYNGKRLNANTPAILFESELDALSVMHAVPDFQRITAVATGSTSASRIMDAVTALAMCPIVYVAFDSDDAGENASQWWLEFLDNAVRLRPTRKDVNDMLLAGDDIEKWIGV